MIATNPITINGNQYDRYSLNLAITGSYRPDGQSDACINLLLTPTRISEEGEVITATEAARSLLRGKLAEVTDTAEQAAVSAIQSALQAYLQAKGL